MAVMAPAAFAADATGPLWQKVCDQKAEGKPCWIEQFAIAMPGKTIVLHVRFDRRGGDRTRMVVSAPLGVLLPPGLKIVLDGGAPLTLPFERCAAQGCDAVAVLDQSALDKFVKGKTLIMYYDVSDKASTNIPIRLEGLADALKSLPR